VSALLADGKLTVGHARALIKADDPVALAQQVVAEGLNVRQTEMLAQAHKPGAYKPNTAAKPNGKGPVRPAKPAAEKDADTKALERDLSHRLGLKVEIDFDGAAGGQVVVHYRSLEQLDDILAKLNS
jgi:ParB family chromosome partitioning protein